MSYRLSNVNRVKVTCRGRVRASWIVQPNLYDTRSLFRCLPFLLFPFFPSPPFFFFFFYYHFVEAWNAREWLVCTYLHGMFLYTHGRHQGSWNSGRELRMKWYAAQQLRENHVKLRTPIAMQFLFVARLWTQERRTRKLMNIIQEYICKRNSRTACYSH